MSWNIRYLVGGAHDLESIFVSFKHSGYFFSGEDMMFLAMMIMMMMAIYNDDGDDDDGDDDDYGDEKEDFHCSQDYLVWI